MTLTSLLIVEAGPYGLATAAHAQANGIGTVVVGHPMGFWRDNARLDRSTQQPITSSVPL